MRFIMIQRYIKEIEDYFNEVQQMKELAESVGNNASLKTKVAMDQIVVTPKNCK